LPENIEWWRDDYIFCFRGYFLLPKSLLDRASVAAINFHPAPAKYPGSGCLNWALYDNANTYGTTAHLMNEKD
jgi:methionyl-tRNA formyltransferase